MAFGLLATALLRESAKHPWQLALTLLSIAAGVAVIVGVEVANQSALTEFDRANRIIDGVSSHRIVGGTTGLDEEVYRLVKVVAGIRDAAPVISAKVEISGDSRQYQLLGIDPFSDFRIRQLTLESEMPAEESRSWPVYVSNQELAEVGSTLLLRNADREQQFSIVGSIQSDPALRLSEKNLIVTDIGWAQAFLDRPGKISHIELKLSDPEKVARLRALLPASVQLIDVELYNSARRDMTHAFRVNLTALGLLALVIAMFLVYSAVSFQVVRRRSMVALLRLTGVDERQLGGVLFAELLLIGVAGSLAGVVLGYFLAVGLSGMVAGTIDSLYFSLEATRVRLNLELVLKAALVGVGATILASLVPIVSSSRAKVLSLHQPKVTEFGRRKGISILLPASLLISLAGAALLILPQTDLILSFAGLFFLICALATLTPWIIDRFCLLASRLNVFGRVLVAKMVVLNIGAHQRRTAVAVAALSIAVSATLGVALMIESFRFSVEHWLEGYLRSDIYIAAPSLEDDGLDPQFLNDIAMLPGVISVSKGRRRSLATQQGPLTLFVLETSAHGFAGFQIKNQVAGDLRADFEQGEKILVSEPYSRHQGVDVGDRLDVPTDVGLVEFEIAAVYYDYSSDRGLIAMSRNTYNKYFQDRLVSSAGLVLDSDGDTSQLEEQIQQLDTAPQGLFLRSNRDLRQASLEVFDQTFKVTEVLRWLAVFVAVVGITSALMSLQLERGREYSLLKAVGFSQWQLGGQILLETGITGLIAGLMAIPMGLVLALSLINVINVRSFGWSMQTVISIEMIASSIILAVGAALLGGLYPAWRLWRSSITAGMRND